MKISSIFLLSFFVATSAFANPGIPPLPVHSVGTIDMGRKTLCNTAFPGSLKVCHPMGTAPAGVVNLENGLQMVVLTPFSMWKSLEAHDMPLIAVFRGNKVISQTRKVPYFENVQSAVIKKLPGGSFGVTLRAYKGGNAGNQEFTLVVGISPSGQVHLKQ